MTKRCIILLGGSFDPVHVGHVELGKYFCRLFRTDELRLIPAGNPWQKPLLKAAPQQRIDMLKCAFEPLDLSITIDTQEIDRPGATYTIDTLRSIRHEVGRNVSLIFLMGADQLLRLDTWHNWRQLFELTNIAVSARPGFSNSLTLIPKAIADEFSRRFADPGKIILTAAGLTYLATDLQINVSATEIRAALQNKQSPTALVPAPVLNYIKENNLYKE
ncbi:nicotinate (nicotinamide) nucleotide adenylyltransferase [Oxalobacter paraformigenes]|uniref:Probable nicotinate-nucleotide adenylyltransferase n=1 Tax=Oxalobacter paraformigenes TaxID=556268 RepID=C3X1B5_9BURK|nr:nicotinate (nicotinamide) nucleotide adenylyltransferase [Oxalobacter paraformigenes]EEO27001.1 nicotinate (nicotinamide) nucleotide adenylyltransferase [Oxalobacter paraformigenes]